MPGALSCGEIGIVHILLVISCAHPHRASCHVDEQKKALLFILRVIFISKVAYLERNSEYFFCASLQNANVSIEQKFFKPSDYIYS